MILWAWAEVDVGVIQHTPLVQQVSGAVAESHHGVLQGELLLASDSSLLLFGNLVDLNFH